MPAVRDPLSVAYDRPARRVLLAAIRARPRYARIWVTSPGRQFRDLDAGTKFSLTANERAMLRACYFQVRGVPKELGVDPQWSLKADWSRIENHSGRWGRYLRVRLYRYGSGYSHAERNKRTSYVDRPELRSMPGARVR